MKKHSLNSEVRDLTGKKVKKLRKEGIIPATIYGKDMKSLSISLNGKDFEKLYSETGETGVVELTTGKNTYPVLISSIQKHPVSGIILHVEFRKVDLKQKVKANVPVEITGESKAVENKLGILLTLLNEIEVEALPNDLPESIMVDVTELADVNQDIKISDLHIDKKISISLPDDTPLAKIAPLAVKEEVAEVKEETAVAEGGDEDQKKEESKEGNDQESSEEKK